MCLMWNCNSEPGSEMNQGSGQIRQKKGQKLQILNNEGANTPMWANIYFLVVFMLTVVMFFFTVFHGILGLSCYEPLH